MTSDNALSGGDVDKVQAHVSVEGVEVDDDQYRSEQGGLTLLQLACIGVGAQLALARILLEHGSLNTADRRVAYANEASRKNGFTALQLAVFKGEPALVSLLLQTGGADASAGGVNQLPPLHIAALCGNGFDIIEPLLNSGADLSTAGRVSFTALHVAAYFGHEKTVKAMLSACSGAVWEKKGENNSNSEDELLRLVNACDSVNERPLHLAASKGFVGIVEALLQHGVDPSLHDNEGNTALHFCSRAGHVQVVERLLDGREGAPDTAQTELVGKLNAYDDSPLHLACYAGKLEVANRLLCVAGTNLLTQENKFSETPLHAACTGGKSVELVAHLLRQPGVDVNFQGKDGHTALHSACFHGHYRIVQLLLDNSADPTISAKKSIQELCSPTPVGPTAADVATPPSASSSSWSSSRSHSQLDDQQTPILWAYERGHDLIVALLKQYANRRPDDVCSEYSSGYEGSRETPLPSPLGRLRSMTKEKAEILQLRALVPSVFHLSLADVDFQEAIGAGSFGKVYRGVYKSKLVAVKRYRAVAFGHKSEVDMFCREVSILYGLRSPYVVGFVGACLDDPSQFAIVTEYVSGGCLFSLLHERKQLLDLMTKLLVDMDVAKAMEYLHQLKEPVIHRDLNSHNILLHESGRAVVADFGESRLLSSNEHDNMTKQPGNLRWMAPEVFSQCSQYGTQADVFSYSLCVWEIHAAQLPFAHLKPAAAAAEMAYKRSRPPLPAEPDGAFPAHIVELLQEAWQPDPQRRPSFAELMNRMEPQLKELFSAGQQRRSLLGDSSSLDWQQQQLAAAPSQVSALKNQWEARSLSAALEAANCSERRLSTTPSDRIWPPPNSIDDCAGAASVEQLRQRLDNHGYVSTPPLPNG